jgi:NADPH-dependent 7-cyano-7-deazaguanine reductase QueF-like protein
VSTIRKTISISSKDRILQEVIKNVDSYEVSHVIRQLMYDGLKYRNLVEQGVINDVNMPIIRKNTIKIEENEQKQAIIEEKEPKTVNNEQNSYNFDEFDEEIDINSVKLEEIEENDEDLEDLLLNNS